MMWFCEASRGKGAGGRKARRGKGEAAKEAPAPAAAGGPREAKGPAKALTPGTLRKGSRVEFDGRLVHGQTAKSGAIYLFARKRSELKSMVEERTNYRKEILRTIDTKWSKAAK